MKESERMAKGEETRTKILDAAKTLVMAKGFAGTTIDDILRETKLTKGAFFHHFKGKADLARELVERYALNDLKTFQAFLQEAEESSNDPLQQTIEYLKAFERYISRSSDTAPGCMYASFTYESQQFDPSVLEIVSDTLRRWTSLYVKKYQDVLDVYEPAAPVTARQLAELTVSIVEGGIILQRAYGDHRITCRQSEQLRNYLYLLFGNPRSAMGGAAGKQGKRKTPAKG